MTDTFNYMFNNLSRMTNDACAYTERNKVNTKHANYNLTNLYNTNCDINNDLVKATSMPNVFFNGSTQIGPNGCNVDTYSNLLKGTPLLDQRDRTMLHQRTFLTVPYLGKGNCNVVMESRIKQGDTFKERKSEVRLNESTKFEANSYPLNSEIKSRMTNPAYCIENEAADGWVRGGVSTREMYKSSSYQNGENVKRQGLMD